MQLLSDIRNFHSLSEKRKVLLTAYLMTLSGVLSVLDGMIPKPVPMAKLGLANLVTLILVNFGSYGLAFEVALGRTLAGAMVTGTLFSITHLLSTIGALFAVFLMSLVHRLGGRVYSLYGISLWGAFASVSAQGVVSGFLIGWDKGVLFLLSIMLLLGQMNGLAIAWLSTRFLRVVSNQKVLEEKISQDPDE